MVPTGFWRWRVADLLHVKAAPWPLRADAHIFDVVLVVISGFAVQQIGGQLWRVFFTRIPEQARALPVLQSYSRTRPDLTASEVHSPIGIGAALSRAAYLQRGRHCKPVVTCAVSGSKP